jgi:chorismate mutase-like protein
MPAFDSAQAPASTGIAPDRVLLDALVVVAARRLVLGVDVAAAKFLSGQRVDDLVREQEILESMASTLKRAELQHPLRIEFFRDQIEANKVIQRSLYRYWSVHPEEFPVRRRHLTAELRPQLDLVDRHMLQILVRMKNMPPVRRSHIDALFDRRLRTGTALRQLGELRRDAADVALRSLYRTICSPATTADPHGAGHVPRPSTTPPYFLGRPTRVWIAAFRRGSLRAKATPESGSAR